MTCILVALCTGESHVTRQCVRGDIIFAGIEIGPASRRRNEETQREISTNEEITCTVRAAWKNRGLEERITQTGFLRFIRQRRILVSNVTNFLVNCNYSCKRR